jgi:hypothetical protein
MNYTGMIDAEVNMGDDESKLCHSHETNMRLSSPGVNEDGSEMPSVAAGQCGYLCMYICI